MKNLNSLIAFAVLVLVVAGCSSSSNNNNSSNSSNNNSSNNSNSSNSDSTNSSKSSKDAPADSEGVFHDDNAGIRLQAPKGWKTKLDGEQLVITAPDSSMTMVFWVPEGSFESAIKDLDRQLSRKIKRMKTTTNGSESSTNGMPIYTVAGTGEVDGNDIEWSVDIIKAPKKPTIVLSVAQPGAWDKYSAEIKEFVASIKPTS
jgi:flagellum-specific peptidoglycan hydrolase FlgJ